MTDFNFLSNLEYCKSIVSEMTGFLLYSHIPATLIVLALSFYVFTHNKSLFSRILLSIGIIFSIWTTLNIGIWLAYDRASMLMALWAPIELFSVSLFILNFAFIYFFIRKTNIIPKWIPFFSFLVLAPIIFSLATPFNLTGYDLGECIAIEYHSLQTYVLYLKIFISALTLAFAVYGYLRTKDKVLRSQVRLLCLGTIIFLLSFFIAGYVSEATGNYSYEFYGLFGMVFFMAILINLIVRFRMFGLKVIAGQALVLSLIALIASLLFVVESFQAVIITVITLILVIILGYALVRSIKKEIQQKEELAKLNTDLGNLIKQRESLVHLVTHKVKGAFTRSKYIFAGMLDGTFGDANPEIKKRAQQGLESDDGGIQTVDLVLNAANLQKGTVKYEMKPIDFKELILKTLADKKVQAEAKGLQMESGIEGGVYNVLGDVFWLKEAVNNLIDNAIKYTPKGKVVIYLHDGNGKVVFSVKDSGMGITDEDKKVLFTEGGRGKDSVHVNVDSTGYGLYTVKLVIEAHGGRVWAESEGQGKGSTFFIELSAISENKLS